MMPEPRSFDAYLPAPFGGLGIGIEGDRVARISFLSTAPPSGSISHPLLDQVRDQLRRYMEDPHARLQLPLHWQGTPFQQRVWQELRRIPVGSTRTYGEIAKRPNSSARAVGGACRTNHLVLIVPCHRVVAAGGLGGFSGETEGVMPNIKRWLLNHEGALNGEW